VFPASRPSRGVVSCVALGLPGHPPKGVVPRYPPRGVLRDCSRPVPGSCRGVVSPLSGGFPHTVGGGPRRRLAGAPADAVSPPDPPACRAAAGSLGGSRPCRRAAAAAPARCAAAAPPNPPRPATAGVHDAGSATVPSTATDADHAVPVRVAGREGGTRRPPTPPCLPTPRRRGGQRTCRGSRVKARGGSGHAARPRALDRQAACRGARAAAAERRRRGARLRRCARRRRATVAANGLAAARVRQ